MDFLGKSGKSGSAKDDIKFLPDLFNDEGQLQETVNTELCDMNFFGSGNDINPCPAEYLRLFCSSVLNIS